MSVEISRDTAPIAFGRPFASRWGPPDLDQMPENPRGVGRNRQVQASYDGAALFQQERGRGGGHGVTQPLRSQPHIVIVAALDTNVLISGILFVRELAATARRRETSDGPRKSWHL